MSQQRDLIFADDPGPPRVKRRPDGLYTKVYMGTQRAPCHPDEVGALYVIDLLFGGRVALFPYDSEFLRILQLRSGP